MALSKLSNTNKSLYTYPAAVFQTPASSSAIVTGTFIGSDSINWRYWIFKADMNITCNTSGFADILVVGGGGTGAAEYGGGGGGGGVLSLKNAYFASGSIPVVVGAGAVAYEMNVAMTYSGHNGRASRIGNYYAPGGGGAFSKAYWSGASYKGAPGSPGGSGGGGAASNLGYSGGVAAIGWGNNGGIGFYMGTTVGQAGGGGGGAGLPGTDALYLIDVMGGAGGIGIITTIITTTIATSASVGQVSGGNLYFAGGGGGCGYDAVRRAGGLGGGGQSGTVSLAGVSGTAWTGGGGGGGGVGTSSGATQPGSGGSGVVILRVKE